jgi:hypothetical protein
MLGANKKVFANKSRNYLCWMSRIMSIVGTKFKEYASLVMLQVAKFFTLMKLAKYSKIIVLNLMKEKYSYFSQNHTKSEHHKRS